MESGNYVYNVKKNYGINIGCIEEIAYQQGFINDKQLLDIINNTHKCDYKEYLEKIYGEKNEFYKNKITGCHHR